MESQNIIIHNLLVDIKDILHTMSEIQFEDKFYEVLNIINKIDNIVIQNEVKCHKQQKEINKLEELQNNIL